MVSGVVPKCRFSNSHVSAFVITQGRFVSSSSSALPSSSSFRICIRLVPGAGRLRNRRHSVSRGRKRVVSAAAAWITASVSTPESNPHGPGLWGRRLCRERLDLGRFEDAGRDVQPTEMTPSGP
ncbi:hypothetical protein LX32DRAFT_283054 [Colletotrichum zoysiae]|uniref:Uncharacterized protein n=1 Tax=Colletotrichum zoysiae TaxID=1216348 RepID=A0AAD9HLJ8_9PEZI|nr:hypothetical protein LX32DRAFT_283054 [Colletotrichum zoysiae]